MNWPEWLNVAVNAIAVVTTATGILIYIRSRIKRYMEKRRQGREEARLVEEDLARMRSGR